MTNLKIDRELAIDIIAGWNANLRAADIAEAMGLDRRDTWGITNVITGRLFPELQERKRKRTPREILDRLNARGSRK